MVVLKHAETFFDVIIWLGEKSFDIDQKQNRRIMLVSENELFCMIA